MKDVILLAKIPRTAQFTNLCSRKFAIISTSIQKVRELDLIGIETQVIGSHSTMTQQLTIPEEQRLRM
jgi:hypothetical protein